MSTKYEYTEDDFIYCFECYKQYAKAKKVKNFAEYKKKVRPDAVVWLQETRDVVCGYCTLHQVEENAHPRFRTSLPYTWHSVADRSTWKLATFNGRPGYTPNT